MVEEKKEKSDVEIKIVEKDGGYKVAECCKISYNFKTGMWTGDDDFNDSDGYGHYNGKK